MTQTAYQVLSVIDDHGIQEYNSGKLGQQKAVYQHLFYLGERRGNFKETVSGYHLHQMISCNRKDQQEIYLKDDIGSRKCELLAIVITADLCPTLVIGTTITELLHGAPH